MATRRGRPQIWPINEVSVSSPQISPRYVRANMVITSCDIEISGADESTQAMSKETYCVPQCRVS